MKALISQPTAGKSNEQIKEERANIIERLNMLGCEVTDTVSEVDVMLFMNGWEKARGCRIEHDICLKYDIPTMYEYEL